jgi:hypothetical protein
MNYRTNWCNNNNNRQQQWLVTSATALPATTTQPQHSSLQCHSCHANVPDAAIIAPTAQFTNEQLLRSETSVATTSPVGRGQIRKSQKSDASG